MARLGGLGIIHRYMTIEEQAKQVERVKRAEAHMIKDPVTINKNTTLEEILESSQVNGIRTFIVAEQYNINGSNSKQ